MPAGVPVEMMSPGTNVITDEMNATRRSIGKINSRVLDAWRETGMAALVATHNPELAARMDRTVRLKDGVLDA